MKIIERNGRDYVALSKNDEIRVLARLRNALNTPQAEAGRRWVQKSIDKVHATVRIRGFTVSSLTDDDVIRLILAGHIPKNSFDDDAQLAKRDKPTDDDHLRHRLAKLKSGHK